MYKQILFIYIFFVLLCNNCIAQQYEFRTAFNIESGLPSSHLYETAEDNNGFLWIGTDNGVSRFDGKRFVNYSTKNGLPSNDVLQVIKDNHGTIWVNCYKQPPSYFDEIQNRFVSFENNKDVVKRSNSLLYPLVNPSGGVYFSDANGSIFFKNKKFVGFVNVQFNNLKIGNDYFYIIPRLNINKNFVHNISIFSHSNQLVGKLQTKSITPAVSLKIDSNTIFETYRKQIYITKIESAKPFRFSKQILQFAEVVKWSAISKNELAIIFMSGKINVFDRNSLKSIQIFDTKNDVNYCFKDSHGNLWVSTLDRGLLKYSPSSIKNLHAIANMNSNFLSIHIDDDNKIFAGNYQGQIFEKNKKTILCHTQKEKNSVWIRSIANFDKSVIAVSDNGYTVGYKKNVAVVYDNKKLSLKTALKINKNELILGSNHGLSILYVAENVYKKLPSPVERTLSLVKKDDSSFWFTANSGIFLYDLKKQKYALVFPNSNLNNDNVQGICRATNGDLWFHTFKGNIFLIKNNQISFKIINSSVLPTNITKLVAAKNQLWIASKNGIFVINTNSFPKFSVTKISTSDGLYSDFVNDIVFKNDSIYAATSRGVSVISAVVTTKNFDIKPVVISTKINNIQVTNQKVYDLSKNQTNIILEVAGVDLTGHFNKFQYKLNNNKWFDIQGNIFNLLLKSGKNEIVIRASDENNNLSAESLSLTFNVAIPIYNALWFQILLSILMTGVLFFMYNRRKLQKQQTFFKQQLALEKQRSKITADLHDEIGSTLSSLQINSNVASKLMEKDIDSAQIVLRKVESQANSLAEKIGDIIWSMKPGKEEFMTLSTRIKNFCNEVLGSTDINYVIKIDNEIDTLITNFSVRKNVLLITKEAINNALKYSNATKIKVFIRHENNQISIIISDNGIGFDTNASLGNGIGNMKNRATELKATFELVSTLNLGTSIKLQFNAIP